VAARAIETAGISTLTLSILAPYTRAVGAPRVAGLHYPCSRPPGNPGDADGQRAVLRAALRSLEAIDGPGGAVQLPFVWPEARAQAQTRGRPKEPPRTSSRSSRSPGCCSSS
jgi:hypothetical protein